MKRNLRFPTVGTVVVATVLSLVGVAQGSSPQPRLPPPAAAINHVMVGRLNAIVDKETLENDTALSVVAQEVSAFCAMAGSDLPAAADLAAFLGHGHKSVTLQEHLMQYAVVIVDGEPVTVCYPTQMILISDDPDEDPVAVSLTPPTFL